MNNDAWGSFWEAGRVAASHRNPDHVNILTSLINRSRARAWRPYGEDELRLTRAALAGALYGAWEVKNDC